MENSAANSPAANGSGARQRRIELRRATIEVDGLALHRTAQFTDGSRKAVRMEWRGISRVGAFRCDDGAAGFVCIAVTDERNVVILNELMEGWDSVTSALTEHLPGCPPAAAWKAGVAQPQASANWTVLFKAK